MHHPIVNVAIDAARKAGDIVVRALDRLDEVKVVMKGKKNFTTDVDQRAEQTIIKILQKSYPEYGFVCEESGEHPGNEYTWIIDPLDGTTNFIHGFPHFCVSIALQHQGQIEHGVIYDPIRQELFTASRGRGAQLNNRRIRVASRRKLEGTLISLSLTKPLASFEFATKVREEIAQKAAGLRRSGSAALDLAYVAAGRLDGFIDWNLRPWDVAAGALLVQEAGGLVVDPTGQEDYLNSNCIVAANTALITTLIQTIG